MRRNDPDFHTIDLPEFPSAFPGGTGHPGKVRKPAEILLIGDRSHRPAFLYHIQTFLYLQRLPEAVAVAPAVRDPASMRIHDLQLSFLYNVIHIPSEHSMRLDRLIDQMIQRRMVRQVIDPEKSFRMRLSEGSKHCCPVTDDHNIIGILLQTLICFIIFPVQALYLRTFQPSDKPVHCQQILIKFLCSSRQDHRCDCFIQQDAVRLVHQHEKRCFLHLSLFIDRQLIPQVIKAKLTVRTIENITCISRLFLFYAHIRLCHRHAEAQQLINRTHPFTVPPCQIRISSCDPCRSAQRIQHRRKYRCQSLPLSGLHLHRASVRHCQRSHQLFIIRFYSQCPPNRHCRQRKQSFTMLHAVCRQAGTGRMCQGRTNFLCLCTKFSIRQ